MVPQPWYPWEQEGRRTNREGSFSAAWENRVVCTWGLEGLLVGRKMTRGWDDCVVASKWMDLTVHCGSETGSIFCKCLTYYAYKRDSGNF